MREPAYRNKLERMVRDQKEILVEAAYGDSGIWESLTELYLFEKPDRSALRSYIRSTYRPDGSPLPEAAGNDP